MSGEQEVKVDGVALKGQQLEFYNTILEALGKKEKFHWCVLGLAGTGKTTLLKAIQNIPGDELGYPKCLSTAYVYTAAELIDARIINSIFSLENGQEPTYPWPGAIDRTNEKLHDIDVLLIDNINYVGDETFYLIDKRLREARRSAEPFGGISVICFGDLYQQKQPKSIYANGSRSLRLWRLFELFELTENYRFQSEEERIVLKTIATLSDTPALTEEERALMEEAKNYLGIHCQFHGESAQEVATKLRELRTDHGAEDGTFAAIIRYDGMVNNVKGLVKDVEEVVSAYNYQDSQGLSFDGVIVVRSTSWGGQAEPLNEGEFYSAISRAKSSLRNCCITPMDPMDFHWTVPAGANEEMARLRAANNQGNNP
ncbi:hypothetical protein CAEBREN_21093 [Caenorhabditis brenneri]|uniref:ATP-dependent DNA helicase n=1 Tax=Caenorhabditis brenneri TaxID=135651 RepID=G0N2U3_CAEBE|nr:hypothetical protein CAEBREN_21093 [Caenorhabditis brenneri]